MKINRKSVAKLYRWALDEKVLYPPRLRLNVFPNCQEYVYFLKFRNAFQAFERLKNESRVIYETICSGVFDLMVIASEKIDFSMEHGFEYFILSGPRGDYLYNQVDKKSMGDYLNELQVFLNTQAYIKSEIVTPLREEFVWDELDLALFKLLKQDLRTKYVDILKCFGFSKSVFYDHLHSVMERCSVWTPYFPRGYPNYNEYLTLFKTDHEEQLIEQLKKIPVHCPILKVDGWIFAYIMVERDFLQHSFFEVLNTMQTSGFIEEYKYSIPIYHWKQPFTTQDLRHLRSPRRTD